MQIPALFICLLQLLTNAPESPKMMEIEFVGTYQTGRAPCEWLPDGSRRWAKTSGFNINKVIRGHLAVAYIEIAQEKDLDIETGLQEGESYTVLLFLSTERFSELELDDETVLMTYQNPILIKEITHIAKIE